MWFCLGGKGGGPLRYGNKESYTDLNLKNSTSECDSSSVQFFNQIESPLHRHRLCVFYFWEGREGTPLRHGHKESHRFKFEKFDLPIPQITPNLACGLRRVVESIPFFAAKSVDASWRHVASKMCPMLKDGDIYDI